MSLKVEFSATIVNIPPLKLTLGGTAGICSRVGGGGGGAGVGGGAGGSCLTGRLRAVRCCVAAAALAWLGRNRLGREMENNETSRNAVLGYGAGMNGTNYRYTASRG